jgi:hypothetical protein
MLFSNDAVSPFHSKPFKTTSEVFREGLNEEYWAWGLVLSQGNAMDISIERARERLLVIKVRLLKRIFGNKWRDKGELHFIVFQHGSRNSADRHFHILMGIEGDHDWSSLRIASEIQSIDEQFRRPWEKLVHVDT